MGKLFVICKNNFYLLIVVLVVGFVLPLGLKSQAQSASFKLVKSGASPTVYLVSNNNLKLAIPSSKIFLSYGFHWQDILTVDDSQINNLPDVSYVSLKNSKSIYKLEGPGKRLLSSSAVKFFNLSSNNVLTLSPQHFSYFKTGAQITKAELEKNAANGPVVIKPSALENPSPASSTCKEDASVGGKYGCVIYDAYVKNDVSLCGTITDSKWQSVCYSSFIPDSGDVLANCKKITDQSFVLDCYAVVATAKKDSKICNLVTDETKKNLCLMNVGIALKDASACNYAPTEKKDSCYFTYALINQEASACDKIASGSEYKTNCSSLAKK